MLGASGRTRPCGSEHKGWIRTDCAACGRLSARLPLLVDGHSGPRRSGHLHAMLHASKIVGDIPVVGLRVAGDVFAVPDLLAVSLRIAALATHVGADRTARHRTADGGHVLAASIADLVAEDSADHRACDRAR